MSDPFSDRYWIEEFQITQADLDRIAAHIRDTGQAHDLTALARRVVRGRLRYGPVNPPGPGIPPCGCGTQPESGKRATTLL